MREPFSQEDWTSKLFVRTLRNNTIHDHITFILRRTFYSLLSFEKKNMYIPSLQNFLPKQTLIYFTFEQQKISIIFSSVR